MAVYSTVVTAPATTATTTTLTGWAPYVAVTVPGSLTTVYVSTDGTAVTTGVDSIPCPSGTTTYLRNRTEAPQLTATIPGAFDPSAVAAQTHNGTPISTVSSSAAAGVVLALVTSPGLQPVIG